MILLRRLMLIVTLAFTSPVVPALVSAQQPAEQQGEFLPAESLPQRERMPAAPLLVSAYAFVMLVLFAYVFSLSRRIGAVKSDIGRLESEIKRGTRA
jgi:hypothetical protein